MADFGFAQKLRSPYDKIADQFGTPIYMAPELLANQLYDKKVDIWAIGILLYELLFKAYPYDAPSIDTLLT